MEELGEEDSESGTVLAIYRGLKRACLRCFPEIIDDALVERDPGDTPKNLRIFFIDGSFMDVWVSDEKYSFHWQSDDEVIRFDNAPHHHEIETFPDHLHFQGEVRPTPISGGLNQKLTEALSYIKTETELQKF